MRSIALIAAFSALGGFLFGYDLGLIGGAILDIEEDLNTTDNDVAAIVGSAKAGAVLGTFFGGAYMYRYGRLKAIAVNSIFFIVGPLVMAFAQSVSALVLGRFVIGLGVGTSAVVVPAYLGEMAPPSIRGAVIIMYEIMLCIGMMSSTLVDASMQSLPNNWRWMVGSPLLPALLLGAAPLVLPESPRWLVMRGNLPAALAALHEVKYSQRLQPGVTDTTPEVEHELMLLWDAVERDCAAGAANGTAGGCRSAPADADVLRVPLEIQDPPPNHGTVPSAPPPNGQAAAAEVGNVFADPDVFSGTAPAAAGAPPHGEKAGSPGGVAAATPNDALVEVALNGTTGLPGGRGGAVGGVRWHSGKDGADEQPAHEHLYALNEPFWRVLAQQVVSSGRLFVRAVSFGTLDNPEEAGERRAVRIALLLAFFNQAGASTSLINYAPEVLHDAGVESRQRAMQLSAAIGGCKTLGILLGIALVDKAGRRPLLLAGSAGCAAAMAALAYGRFVDSLWLTLAAMCTYMLMFSASWAGVFWVLCSELFSMTIKSAAMSLATAALFAVGAVVDFCYPALVSALEGGAFAMFAVAAAAGGVYVFAAVPETRGLSLMDIQLLLQQGGWRLRLPEGAGER